VLTYGVIFKSKIIYLAKNSSEVVRMISFTKTIHFLGFLVRHDSFYLKISDTIYIKSEVMYPKKISFVRLARLKNAKWSLPSGHLVSSRHSSASIQ
jgi:hypothetical protein